MIISEDRYCEDGVQWQLQGDLLVEVGNNTTNETYPYVARKADILAIFNGDAKEGLIQVAVGQRKPELVFNDDDFEGLHFQILDDGSVTIGCQNFTKASVDAIRQWALGE